MLPLLRYQYKRSRSAKTGQLVVQFSIIFLTGQIAKDRTVRSKTGHLPSANPTKNPSPVLAWLAREPRPKNRLASGKCSTIQRENVNRGHAETSIATNVQNSIQFHGHKHRDVVSICQSPHQWLSVVHQTRPHSDAAVVGLSKVSKVIQSGLCLSFCYKFFHKSVSSKSSNSYRFVERNIM